MLSIIIPAYNEETRIISTLQEYLRFFNKNTEIIVVNDGSKDNTKQIIEQFMKKHKNLKLINQKNQGKGKALLTGFKAAQGDLISFVDADNATTPDQLDKIIQEMENNDIAFGSRYMKQSILDRKRTFKEQLGSRAFNFLIKLILNLNFKDTQCGAKVFKKQVIDTILPNLIMSKWAFDISLLYTAKKYNFKLKEIPIKWLSKGESKFNMFRCAPAMFKTILQLRFK